MTATQAVDAVAQAQLARAHDALRRGQLPAASALAQELAQRYPDHPDVLRVLAAVHTRRGEHAAALTALQRAVVARPDDAPLLCALGGELAAGGRLDAAMEAFQRACALQPGLALAWYDLGIAQVRAVQFEAAEASLRQALQLAPADVRTQLQLAELAAMRGDTANAIAGWRVLIAAHPACGAAWWGLAGAGALGDADIPTMQAALRRAEASERDRIALGFAIARVLDRSNRVTEAMGVLGETHAHAARLQPWDTAAFRRGLDAVLTAFAGPVAAADAPEQGRGVIFIVGLPRSGSTLTEQILASHSQVAGSGELRDLPQVLNEESQRRGRAYPEWVADASADDWRRLGARYLERTARWRLNRPYCTDKLPGNWLHVGAIHAMLPGAKVVVCRRDPVETCFACYRHDLPADGQVWTHRFADLGDYWAGFDRAVGQWRNAFPAQVYEHRLEDLQRDPVASVRALLAFCGLPFEDACLAFDANPRTVRSPSAAQVRAPLQSSTARAPLYGTLLDPLRAALGFVDVVSGHH